ncbi:MAG: hypothetical protein ABL931_05975 [Usitatibacteraceae bacterium]
MKQSKNILVAATLAALATIAFGCSSSRTAVTVQEATEITKGKELTDLQRAFEAGALTQKEYEQVRKVIMRRDN